MSKNIVSVEKIDVVSNVSDHYPLKLVLNIAIEISNRRIQRRYMYIQLEK